MSEFSEIHRTTSIGNPTNSSNAATTNTTMTLDSRGDGLKKNHSYPGLAGTNPSDPSLSPSYNYSNYDSQYTAGEYKNKSSSSSSKSSKSSKSGGAETQSSGPEINLHSSHIGGAQKIDTFSDNSTTKSDLFVDNKRGWIKDLWGLILYAILTCLIFGFSVHAYIWDAQNPAFRAHLYEENESGAMSLMNQAVTFTAIGGGILLALLALISLFAYKLSTYYIITSIILTFISASALLFHGIMEHSNRVTVNSIMLQITCIVVYFSLQSKLSATAQILKTGLDLLLTNKWFWTAKFVMFIGNAVYLTTFYYFVFYGVAWFCGAERMYQNNQAGKTSFGLMLASCLPFLSLHLRWTAHIMHFMKRIVVSTALEKIYLKSKDPTPQKIGFAEMAAFMVRPFGKPLGTICTAAFFISLIRPLQMISSIAGAGKKRNHGCLACCCIAISHFCCVCFERLNKKINSLALINAARYNDSFCSAAEKTKELMADAGLRGPFSLAAIKWSVFFLAWSLHNLLRYILVIIAKMNYSDIFVNKKTAGSSAIDTINVVFGSSVLFLVAWLYLGYFTSIIAGLAVLVSENPRICQRDYPVLWEKLRRLKPDSFFMTTKKSQTISA